MSKKRCWCPECSGTLISERSERRHRKRQQVMGMGPPAQTLSPIINLALARMREGLDPFEEADEDDEDDMSVEARVAEWKRDVVALVAHGGASERVATMVCKLFQKFGGYTTPEFIALLPQSTDFVCHFVFMYYVFVYNNVCICLKLCLYLFGLPYIFVFDCLKY
jgi:hypothetical protein